MTDLGGTTSPGTSSRFRGLIHAVELFLDHEFKYQQIWIAKELNTIVSGSNQN